MGHCYIEKKVKAKDFADLKEKVNQIKDQAAYEDGHSYSGSWNMLEGLERREGTVKDFDKLTAKSAYGYCDVCYYIQKSKRVFVIFGYARS